MNDAENAMLSKQTGVTIGLAIVMLGAAVSGAWWFGHWTGSDKAWKQTTDTRLQSIEEALIDGTSDRWSSWDMIRWANRLRESNPALKVPEPLLLGEKTNR